MKIILLAAGRGSRLESKTDNCPKCMVHFKNKPILHYLKDVIAKAGIKDVIIVKGYKGDKIDFNDARYIENHQYETSNMVQSLFCAIDEFNDDIIVSYTDIIYNPNVLSKIIQSPHEVSVIVDRQWKKLWSYRMSNPLQDAETMKIKNNRILEIGKKPKDYDEIDGQYIGLIKFSKKSLKHVIEKSKNIPNLQNLDMTTFLQMLIDDNTIINPVYIDGGWLEVDTVQDINLYEQDNPLDWTTD